MYSKGIAAMVAAISRAWASRESWATTSTTRPQSRAVSASMKSPVKLIRRARSIPMSWGRRMVSPPPGITPTRAWVSAKRARSDAMRKSQDRASSRPPVTVGPLIAPMTGVRWVASMPKCVTGLRMRSCWSTRRSVDSDFRSTPAQNAGSVPVSTMHPTSPRPSRSVTAASSSLCSSADSALRASGRFNVTVATRSSTSTSTSISVSSLTVLTAS